MNGMVTTARGPVAPDALGRVMMHEHLHSDNYDPEKEQVITEEKPTTPERREYLLREAVPYLRQCTDHGCRAFLDATPPPWRAWPTLYPEISEAAGMHIILSTGFYRDIELGTYWVKKPEDSIWPYVVEASVDELADYCIREITEGIHGTPIRAGAVKLGTSQPAMTDLEKKAFRAGARAQKATGVHVTTHCTRIGAEKSQLATFEAEGVDLSRVVIGHTAAHLMDAGCRRECMEWMKRGVNFLPTNLNLSAGADRWQPLVDAIHEVFDAGLGQHLCLGLDWAFCSEVHEFGPCRFMPPPPYVYMFTDVLPAFRSMGLTAEEEDTMMRTNPQRILPVQ